ncbi:hypothetical protein [Oceanicola sp. 502str15]|uniref:hypothetical protein n=1 Tax=Oceanicola sp. 502str15 TaxID=2696061 RepID=UPI002095BABA|nr:hypothetical protein [Oceanicola sp. 502str15]MCO6383308.1 hypothetical protein [Oceanicola sp. 502str15]
MTTSDAIDMALGGSRSRALKELRARRPEFVTGSEASRAAVLEPAEDLGLSPELRGAVARRVAASSGNARMVESYPRPQDPALAALAEGREPDDPAMATLAQYADMIATIPAKASREELQKLQDAGFSVPQIIALSELLAQVCYQIRVVHGLSLLAEPDA